jgi:hypothetical protein
VFPGENQNPRARTLLPRPRFERVGSWPELVLFDPCQTTYSEHGTVLWIEEPPTPRRRLAWLNHDITLDEITPVREVATLRRSVSSDRKDDVVRVICRDGPAEGQRIEISDPPPKAVRVEVFPEDDDDTGRPVEEGTEFPTIEAKVYGYRLANDFLSEVAGDDRTGMRTVEYEFDPDLDPDIAEYVS